MALAYDADGRISSSNGLVITRDAAGRIASITYAPGKVVTYTYDVRGLLTTVTDWVGGSTTLTYDDAGQLIGVAFPNGVHETGTYDKNGRAATISITSGSTAISSITLQRDAAGQVVSADRSTPNIPAVPAGTQQLAYDAADQSKSATYDASGRVTSDALRAYKWDLASRLQSYSGADGSASFTYDAFGQQISRSSGSANQNYALNYALPLPVVSVVRAGSVDQRYYVWLPSGVLLYSIEAARHFYHFDETGSANFLTDDTGAVTDSYAITPYGETAIQKGSTDNPFTFQGAFGVMQEGTTGLYYMRARYYDSADARFLSRDPVSSLDPRALNPYQYAAGNPMLFNDPAGLEPGLTEKTAFTCVANAGTPVIVRVEGITELVGDLLVQCTRPLTIEQITPQRNNIFAPIVPFVSTTSTRSLGSSGFIDALLLLDEPYLNPARNLNPAGSCGSTIYLSTTYLRSTRNWGSCLLGIPIDTPANTSLIARPFSQLSNQLFTTTPLATLVTNVAPDTTFAIPRFIDGPQSTPNAVDVSICRTMILYPFVTNCSGFDTGLAISNTTTDPFGTAPQQGPVSLYYYGLTPVPATGFVPQR